MLGLRLRLCLLLLLLLKLCLSWSRVGLDRNRLVIARVHLLVRLVLPLDGFERLAWLLLLLLLLLVLLLLQLLSRQLSSTLLIKQAHMLVEVVGSGVSRLGLLLRSVSLLVIRLPLLRSDSVHGLRMAHTSGTIGLYWVVSLRWLLVWVL